MARKPLDQPISAAAKTLEEDIIFGRVQPFERLTEDDVMSRFDMTRHKARRVLAQLRSMELITQDRSGTIVRSFTDEELENAYEVRELLQRQAFARMELPAAAALIAELQAVHERYCEAVAQRDLSAIFRRNDEFHDTLFGACGNDVLAEAIKKHTWMTHGVRSRLFGDPDHLRLACEEHAAFIDALEEGDRERLLDLNERHVMRPKEAYFSSRRWPPKFASER